MIESSFGRRWSLAGSTFVTAAFCVAFIFAESSFFVWLSTTGISLSSTVCTFFSILHLHLNAYTCLLLIDDVGGTIRVNNYLKKYLIAEIRS